MAKAETTERQLAGKKIFATLCALAPNTALKRNIICAVLLLGIIAGYAKLEEQLFIPVCQETDTAGYLILAERIAAGGPVAQADDDMFRHSSHEWVENKRGELVPKYTPGYPVLMALGILISGEKGAFLVAPVSGALALIGAFMLFRLWSSSCAAICATLMLALNAMFLAYAAYPLAHIPNTCFVVWGMYFLWKWSRAPSVLSGVGAGLCLGYAVLIRPTSGLFLIVIAIVLCAETVRQFRSRQWRLAPFGAIILSYVACLVVLGLYNWAVFGDPLTTGYAFSDEQVAFSLSAFRANIGQMFVGMYTHCVGFFFVLGLAGIVARRNWQESAMLLLWFFPLLFLYSSYYWTSPVPDYSIMRFMLCTFPLFIGLSFSLLDRVNLAKWLTCLIVVLVCAAAILVNWTRIPGIGPNYCINFWAAIPQKLAADKAEEHLADGAAIFAVPMAAFHIGRGKNFLLYDLSLFRSQRWSALFVVNKWTPRRQKSRTERLRKFYEENGDNLQEMKKALIEGYMKEGRQVAFILPTGYASSESRSLGEGLTLTQLAEWPVHINARSRRERSRDQTWGIYEVEKP